MTVVQFTVPGRLRGKGRPRAFMYRSGKEHQLKVGHYTPQQTRSAEDIVRFYGREAMGDRLPLPGPIGLAVQLILNPPKSWPKKWRTSRHFVTGKPDVDNIIKLIADALNQIVWLDDSQVAGLWLVREYTLTGQECVHVKIQQLNEASAWVCP